MENISLYLLGFPPIVPPPQLISVCLISACFAGGGGGKREVQGRGLVRYCHNYKVTRN